VTVAGKKGSLFSEESRKAASETRSATAAMINYRKLSKGRRRPDQIPSPKVAIMNFCRECNGWDSGGEASLAEAVRKCPAEECWLWPWRTGRLGG
jgi:hypothetical protein